MRRVARIIGMSLIGFALGACGANSSPGHASLPSAAHAAQQVQHFLAADHCARAAHLVANAVTSCWQVSTGGFVAGMTGTGKARFIASSGANVLSETVGSMSGPMYVLGGDGLDVVLGSPDSSQLAIYNLATGGTAFVRPKLASGIPGVAALPRGARVITLKAALHGRYYSAAILGHLAGIAADRVESGEVLGRLVVVGLRGTPGQRARIAFHFEGSRTTAYVALPWTGPAIVLGASARGLIVENHNTPHPAVLAVLDLKTAQELEAVTPKETEWPR